MNGTPFKLGTFAKSGGGSFAAIVLDDDVISLGGEAAIAKRAGERLESTASLLALLEDWDANFAALQEIVAYSSEGTPRVAQSSPACARCRRWRGPARCSTPRRISRSTSTRCCAPA